MDRRRFVNPGSRGRPYLADAVVIAAAAWVSFASSGLPRALALAALAIALLLMLLRTGALAGLVRWLSASALRLALIPALLALGFVALRSAPPRLEGLPFESPDVAHLPADTRACLERPAVEAYLRALHGDLLQAWPRPEGLPTAQPVVIEFTLLPSGEASSPTVVASPDPSLARAALEAVSRTSPFAQLEPDVACLAGAPVRLSLSNPGD